jgi:hypothetical protein
MTRYNVTVPATIEQGSYKTIACDSLFETYRANALWSYNNARARDGLPPLTRMPVGTYYERIRSTVDSWEVQGNYGQGWECVTAEETYKEAKARIKEYRDNEHVPFRLKFKRERIEENGNHV